MQGALSKIFVSQEANSRGIPRENLSCRSEVFAHSLASALGGRLNFVHGFGLVEHCHARPNARAGVTQEEHDGKVRVQGHEVVHVRHVETDDLDRHHRVAHAFAFRCFDACLQVPRPASVDVFIAPVTNGKIRTYSRA